MTDHIQSLVESGASFAMVNLIFPLTVVADHHGETEFLAMAHWVLPRVPAVGEQVSAVGYRVKIGAVLWANDARVSIRLEPARVKLEALAMLESDGWDVFPAADPEPPSEWLA
jgi:hypothetical protein